ncbi:hypothetical protein EBQ81_03560 [bacterium]|nr:hypothetical protein [bacterium]
MEQSTIKHPDIPDSPFSILLPNHPSQSVRRSKALLQQQGLSPQIAALATRQERRIAHELRQRGIGHAVHRLYTSDTDYVYASLNDTKLYSIITALTITDIVEFEAFINELQGDEPTAYTKHKPVLSRATADFLLLHTHQE